MKTLFKAALFLLGISNPPLQAASEKESIVVGMAAIYAPFEFIENGQIVGYDVDLIRAIAKEMGWQVTLVNLPFEDIIPAIKRDKINLAISAINVTPNRKMELDFSKYYYQPNELVWVYPQYGTYPHATPKKNLRVGVQQGTILETWAKEDQKKHTSYKLSKFNSTPLLFAALENNQLDSILVEKLQAQAFCTLHPSFRYQLTGEVIAGYALAFKKGSLYVEEVNRILEKLQTTGFLDHLQQKWILRSHNTE